MAARPLDLPDDSRPQHDRASSDADTRWRAVRLSEVEWSTMVNTTTTGSRVLILGVSNYYVADGLGMTVELIPHLFGATNRFPTGQRGLYCYWMTGTTVAVLNAFRYLEVV